MLLVALQYKSVTGKLRVEIVIARHMKTLNVQKSPGKVMGNMKLTNACLSIKCIHKFYYVLYQSPDEAFVGETKVCN